jgi:hypothetical protein
VKFGPKKTAEWCNLLRRVKKTKIEHIIIVSGISANQDFEIYDRIHLSPFTSVTPSMLTKAASEYLLPGTHFNPGEPRKLSDFSVIIERHEFDQKIVHNTDYTYPRSGPIGAAIEGLSLVGPSPVRIVRSWRQTDDPMFEFIRAGWGYDQSSDFLGVSPVAQRASMHNGAVEKVRNYIDVSQRYPQVSVSVQRLNSALGRMLPPDKSIDIGTALESILIGTKSTEISYRMSLRLCRLLAHNIEDRKTIRSKMSDFYAMRSDAVHAGKVKAEYKGNNPAELVEWAQKSLLKCLELIVSSGKMPDWDLVELS